MSALANQRWENFAQGIHSGADACDAYIAAGFKPKDRAQAAKSASFLRARDEVAERIRELNDVTAEKVGLTADRVVRELMAIGFAKLSDAVEWRGMLTRVRDQEEGGDVLVIKEIFSNHVRLKDSDTLTPETLVAIKSVSQSPTGGLKIEMHDKQSALTKLGEYLGIFDGQGGEAERPMGQTVDAPPRETLEEWIARRGRELKPEPSTKH